VASTLVAEVLVGLVRRSDDSILATPGWVPSLPSATPGRFELADLLRFAKVVGGGAAPQTYKVKKGDTLSSIAKAKLGDAKRWPELFVLNRAKIRHRDRLTVGQVLTLPGPPRSSPSHSSTRSSGATPCPASPRPSWATPPGGRRSSGSTATWSPTRTTSPLAWSW